MSKRARLDPRGFTLAEVDQQAFQKWYRVGLLAVIVATFVLSFTALSWAGLALGLPWGVHFIVPLFADGGQLIAAAAITTRKTEDRHAFPEWLALTITLGLSVVANVYHAIELGDTAFALWAKVAFSTAIPVCVALFIHIYERSITGGLRKNILADDPDHLRADVWQLEDKAAHPTARAPRTRTAQATPRTTAQDAPRTTPATAQKSAASDARTTVQEKVRTDLDDAAKATGGTPDKPTATDYAADAEGVHQATLRRWVSAAYDQWMDDNSGRDDVTPPTPIRRDGTAPTA